MINGQTDWKITEDYLKNYGKRPFKTENKSGDMP